MPWSAEEETKWKEEWKKAEEEQNFALSEDLMLQWFDKSKKSPKFRQSSVEGKLGDQKSVKNKDGSTGTRYLNKRKDGSMYWSIINPLKIKNKSKKKKTITKRKTKKPKSTKKKVTKKSRKGKRKTKSKK